MQTAKNRTADCKLRTLDATDQQIIRLLHSNGRMTQESIARRVYLSRPAIHERVKRLQENRVITGYRVQVDWRKVGHSLTVFIWVRTMGGNLHGLADTILGLSNCDTLVEECHLITGDWCLLLKARTASTATLQYLLDRLREIPRVRSTITTVVLSSAGENLPEQNTSDVDNET